MRKSANDKFHNLGSFSKELLYLLVDQPDYSQKMNTHKKKYEIPDQGFCSKSDIDYFFTDLMRVSVDEADANLADGSKRQLDMIVKQVKQGKAYDPGASTLLKRINTTSLVSYWKSLDDLVGSFGLQSRWTRVLQELSFGKVLDDITTPIGVRTELNRFGEGVESDELHIIVDKTVTRDQLSDAWSEVIKPSVKGLAGKTKPVMMLDADFKYSRMAYQWHIQDGLSLKDTAKKLNSLRGISTYDPPKISEVVSDYKKKLALFRTG